VRDYRNTIPRHPVPEFGADTLLQTIAARWWVV
jgi:hypothetical protein